MIENPGNWAGNYTYRAAGLHYPATIEQVQELVSRGSKVKALGSRHSFNDIADPGFDEKLWTAADKMRGHIDPAEYKRSSSSRQGWNTLFENNLRGIGYDL